MWFFFERYTICFLSDEITKNLDVKPTTAYTKGDTLKGKKTNRIAKTGRWSLNSSLPEETDIEEKITDLIKQISKNQKYWDTVISHYEVDMFCGLFMEADNRGFDLSPELMGDLSNLGIHLSFDIYGPD